MSTDTRYDLRMAVDSLTLPTFTKVTQEHADGDRVTRIEHDPLLTQLEDAITASMNSGSGPGSSARWQVLPVDGDALHAFTLIAAQIGDWCRIAGLPRHRHPREALRAWYVWTLANETDHAWHTRKLGEWAATIRGKLNPRRQRDLPDPCPTCHATTWADEDGRAGLRPLIVTYQPDAANLLDTAAVRCRACGVEWVGLHQVRAVAYDLEDAS